MSLASFSVRNPVVMNIVTLGIIAVGIVSYMDMPREVFPEVDFGYVYITTVYPGVGPKEIESLITVPVENAIAAVDNIEHIMSTSAEGMSMVVVQTEPDADEHRIALDLQSAINRIPDLPEEATDPVVKSFGNEFPVLTVALASSLPEDDLRSLARILEDELTQLDGVTSITTAGIRDMEIRVEVDPEKLRTLGMSISEIMAALRAQNIDLPGGRLETSRGEYFIRTMGKFDGLDDVANVVIRSDAYGGVVRVSDVARVYDTFATATTLGHVAGEPSIYLNVMKSSDGDYIAISNAVHEFIDGYKALPEGTSLKVVNDFSVWVKRRLNTMHQNGLLGFALVLALLFIFLNGKIAFITAIGIPVAFLGTFIIMRALGYTSNMLSMFAIVLVLGMLVDDAIVVTENVFRHLTMGKSAAEAAVIGGEEVAMPITAAVSTTIAAFLPLTLLPGIMGKFMKFIPLVVAIALMVSIFEAVLILPAHLSEWARDWKWWGKNKTQGGGGAEPVAAVAATGAAPESLGAAAGRSELDDLRVDHGAREAKWFLKLQAGYGWLLQKAVHRRKTTAALGALIFFGTTALAVSTAEFVAFPQATLRQFYIDVETAPGTRLEETERIVSEVEKLVLATVDGETELDALVATIGSQPAGEIVVNASNVARIIVSLTDPADRTRSGREIVDELEAELATVVGAERVEIGLFRGGPPVGKAVEMRVRGDDFDVALEIARKLADETKVIKGTENVHLDTEEGKDEVRIVLDEEVAATLGVDVTSVAMAVRNAFEGGVATKIQKGDEEISVVVKWPDASRRALADLEGLLVTNRFGRPVPLTNVAKLAPATGYGKLHRYDRKSAVRVLGDVDEEIGNTFEINAELKKKTAGVIAAFPGFAVDFGGEDEQTQELLGGLLRAFGLALLLMYAIMAGLFRSWLQPFIIMSTSVPFGVCGVVLGLWASGSPISIIGLIGAVALTGIVVNDSIVLIDFINKARARGLPVEEAVVEAGKMRLRPIILTSVTTIMGLLPMALGLFGAEEFLVPMAAAIVWGLGFSTVLILFMVPAVYAVVDGMKQWMRRRLGLA